MFNGENNIAPYDRQFVYGLANNNHTASFNQRYDNGFSSNQVNPQSSGQHPTSSLNPNAPVFQPSPSSSFTGRVYENLSFISVSGESLRERLDEQLRSETYECMICCERVRWNHQIWSCSQCYHVFHLRCVKKWARTSAENESEQNSGGGWRCPGCQHVSAECPQHYFCFCGQVRDPPPSRGYELPHSCGYLCKKRRNSECSHPCTMLCHPGACPPCPKIVEKSCLCRSTSKKIRCGSEAFQCGKMCQKLLNCEVHACDKICHSGPCSSCSVTVEMNCFCGKNSKTTACSFESASNSGYTCDQICDQTFNCQIHKCHRRCHDGDCGSCPLDPSLTTTCACGKTSLSEMNVVRNSCADVVPSCDKICGKVLKCGPEDSRHVCGAVCHTGDCPPCPLTTSSRCRCGAISENLPCEKFIHFDAQHPFLCERKCSKKRTCKQHKCNETCCIDREHLCMLICGRKLACGIHTCESLCHTGRCRPCTNTSFDELRCYCGMAVIYPPIPCGIKPPVCDNLCTRTHDCDHPIVHTCHSEPSCPPCAYLSQKWCYGNHELRRNIPCYLNDVSCGKVCGRDLRCGQHKCIKTCHAEECLPADQRCTQPCLIPRNDCGHPCGSQCHDDSECPSTSCLTMVNVICPCGRRSSRVSCVDLDRKWASVKMSIVARSSKNNELIDLETLERSNSIDRFKCLECDDECARVERNRRLAEALQVENADLTGELGPPPYTEFLKSQYKTNADYLHNLEKIFSELISCVKNTKAKTRSHVFPPQNRDQRRLIHEYAPFFVIETLSYDVEPIRNVVATAIKGKSELPNVLLSTFMQKDIKPATAVRVAAPTALNTRNASSLPLSGNMKILSSNSSIFKRSPPS